MVPDTVPQSYVTVYIMPYCGSALYGCTIFMPVAGRHDRQIIIFSGPAAHGISGKLIFGIFFRACGAMHFWQPIYLYSGSHTLRQLYLVPAECVFFAGLRRNKFPAA